MAHIGGETPRGTLSPDIPMIQLRPATSVTGGSGVESDAVIEAVEIPEAQTNGFPFPDHAADPAHSVPDVCKGFVKIDPAMALGTNLNLTEVDIIGIPAVGGDSERTWCASLHFKRPPKLPAFGKEHIVNAGWVNINPGMDRPPVMTSAESKLQSPWLTKDVRTKIPKARILFYDHGEVDDSTTLKVLSDRLLLNIRELRQKEKTQSRPIFFVCHSIGGLVVKMALAEAHRSQPAILGDVYGVTFFGTEDATKGSSYWTAPTPHKGSSYLSMPAFTKTIETAMSLSYPIPPRITDKLQLNNELLNTIDVDFRLLAAEFQVWTFFETEDSDLTNSELDESERYPFHAPITSIKSAILNLRHEAVYPLLSDHRECASFGNENEQTKAAYLDELERALDKASRLSRVHHCDLDLRKEVKIEVIGFYGAESAINESKIRVVATTKSLDKLLRDGPTTLLKTRLTEVNARPVKRKAFESSPEPKQYLRQESRAASLLPFGPKKEHPPASGSALMTTAGASVRLPFSTGNPNGNPNRNSVPITLGDAPLAIPERGETFAARPRHRSDSPSASLQSDDSNHQAVSKSLNILKNTSASSSDPELVVPNISFRMPEPARDVDASRPAHRRRKSEAPPMPSRLLSSSIVPEYKRRLSDGGAIPPVRSSSPTRPEFTNQKLVWVHVPYNNPIWVKDVLECASNDLRRDCYRLLLCEEHWHSKHSHARHAEHHGCFLKPHCAFIGRDEPKLSQMCMYFPYLHFDTYKTLVKRRSLIKKRLKQGRSKPVPLFVNNLESLEFKTVWQFLGQDPPINCRRTLDQFGYPSLYDTRARDDDQMLYKMTRKSAIITSKPPREYQGPRFNSASTGPLSASQDIWSNGKTKPDDGGSSDEDSGEDFEENIRDGNVLMVDQLWLWIVDSSNTVTFFPKKEPLSTDGRLYQQADLRNSIFNEVNADLTSKCENSYDLAALIALHAVTVLFERSSHPDLEVFRVFEEAISILTEKMTTSFKKFRARGFRDKANDYSDEVRTTNIRAQHKREGELAEKQNRENTSALLELRDIEDELNTLKELFNIQSNAIALMKEGYQKLSLIGLTANGLSFLVDAEQYLTGYTKQTVTMIDRVKSTRDDFDKLLQMVQRQAQVDEVRLARLQADLASAQSRSVMIFTVFTVIFLPLTFFTGLFGMNTHEWGGADNEYKSLKTIGAVSLPSSAAIIFLALVVAWSTSMRKAFNNTISTIAGYFHTMQTAVHDFIAWVALSFRKGQSEEQKKRSWERRKKKRRKDTWLDGGGDFWESHKVGRDEEYRVPVANRLTVVKGGK